MISFVDSAFLGVLAAAQQPNADRDFGTPI
jgi:hypothetical protein